MELRRPRMIDTFFVWVGEGLPAPLVHALLRHWQRAVTLSCKRSDPVAASTLQLFWAVGEELSNNRESRVVDVMLDVQSRYIQEASLNFWRREGSDGNDAAPRHACQDSLLLISRNQSLDNLNFDPIAFRAFCETITFWNTLDDCF